MNKAAASNGKSAVLCVDMLNGPVVMRFAPRTVGRWENREEFAALVVRAAAKLGYRRDRRCTSGWRKVS